MVFYGLFTDEHLLRNLFVPEALGYQTHDLPLAKAQRSTFLRAVVSVPAAGEWGARRWTGRCFGPRFTRIHFLNALHQSVKGSLLGQNPSRDAARGSAAAITLRRCQQDDSEVLVLLL